MKDEGIVKGRRLEVEWENRILSLKVKNQELEDLIEELRKDLDTKDQL